MPLPRSVQQIREANGGLQNLTDVEIAQHEYQNFSRYYDTFDAFAKDIGMETGGKWGNRLSASVDNYQANLYGVGEALGSEWMGERRKANELSAANSRQLAQMQGAISSYKDVGGIGDAADYVGGLAVDSLPYLGEAVVGGLTGGSSVVAGGLARAGLSRAAARTLGGVAASYPSAVGDILSSQREAGGEMQLGPALVGGVPYAAMNAFGLEGAVARGGLTRTGINALDNMTGVRGGLARMGVNGAVGAFGEGVGETGQEVVNQYFGRMAVDPNAALDDPDAIERYKESFVGGAALGGSVNAAAGGWRRSEGYRPLPVEDNAQRGLSTDLLNTERPPAPPLGIGYNPTPYIVHPDGTVTYGEDQELAARFGLTPDTPAFGKPPVGTAAPATGETTTSAAPQQTTAAPDTESVEVEERLKLWGVKATPKAREIAAQVVAEGITTEEDQQIATALAERKYGNAKKAIEQVLAARETAPAAPAQPQVAVSDQARQSWEAMRATMPAMPAVETLNEAQAAELNEVVEKGWFTLAAADTIVKRASEAPKKTLNEFETEDDLAFRRALPEKLQTLPEADRELLQDWLGLEYDGNGEPILREEGGLSYTQLGAKLVDEKTGKLGVSKQAVEKRVKKALAAAGAPDNISRQRLFQRLGFQVEGTDLDTMGRNLDVATPAAEGDTTAALDEGMVATADGHARVAEMETGTNDDVAAAEEGTTDTAPDVLLDNKVAEETGPGTLRGYLKDDLKDGRVLESDIAEAEYMLDTVAGNGAGAFSSNAISLQAAAVRRYAYVRAAGTDPIVAKIQGDLNEKRKAGAQPATSNQEAVRRGAEQGAVDAPAGGVQEDGDAGRQVPKTAGPAPTVKVKPKKRWAINKDVLAPDIKSTVVNKDVLNDNPQIALNQDVLGSADEQNTTTQSGEGQAGQENAPVAGEARQGGTTQSKESNADRHWKADRGLSVAEVIADLKEFLRKDVLGGKVVVVQRAADLPKGIKVSSASKTQGVAIDDGPYGRVAYLIADNMAPGSVRSVFMHEVGSHLGLDNLLKSEDYAKLIETLKGWARAGDAGSTRREHVLAIAAARRVKAAKTKPEHLRSELLAYFVEEAMDSGITPSAIQSDRASPLMAFLRRVLGLFQNIIKELGVSPETLDAQDVVDLAYGAAQLELASPGPVASGESLSTTNAKFSQVARTGNDFIDKLPDWMQSMATTGAYNAKKALTAVMFTRDLLTQAEKFLGSAKAYLAALDKSQVVKQKLERQAATVLEDFSKLNKVEKGTGPLSVNALIKESTEKQVWLFKPDWVPGVVVDENNPMVKRFNAMSDAAQQVIIGVFRHGHDSLQSLQTAVIENTKSEFDATIKLLRDQGKVKEADELVKAKAKSLTEFQELLSMRSGWPYAPLRRFGKYAVVGRSDAYKAAVAAGDTKLIKQLESDSNHYYVDFAESIGQARAIQKDIADTFGMENTERFERTPDGADMFGGRDMLAALSRIRRTIEAGSELPSSDATKKQMDKVRDNMRQLVSQLYLTALAENSARKGELARRTVAGANKDMMKAFASQAMATAHFTASLTNGAEMEKHLTDMRRDAREGKGDRETKQRYLNEILRRRAIDLDYQETPLTDKAMGFTSMYLLTTNPSYFLLNATQPWMMSLPMIGGRHGYFKSAQMLTRSYGEVAKMLKNAKFDEADYSALPADVRAAVEALADRGVINISLESEMGKFESETGKVTDAFSYANRKIRWATQSVESLNRVTTAIVAYRTERDARLAKGDSKEQAHAAGIEFADKVIYETHGNYAGYNAPTFMRSGFGRLATQFRKFQLIQVSMYARLLNQAFKDADPNERAVARKTLMINLGTLFAAAGTVGMPGFAAISFLLGAIDGDEPDDPEATLRRAFEAAGMPPAMIDFVTKGGFEALGLGTVSGRIGAGGMLSLLPYTDIQMSRDGYADILMGFAGPLLGGVLPRMVDGVGKVAGGDVWKGMEMLAPTGISNFSKAIRYQAEGLTKTNGDVSLAPEDISFLASVAQVVGLPTTTITDRNFLNSAQFKADTFYKERTASLKKAYSEAARSGDSAEMRAVREKWMETQAARKALGYKVQPISELLKAPQEQRKRERESVGGVQVRDSNEGFTRRMAETM